VDDAGEILVRGPTIAAGYLGTDERLTDAEGWLHTGDLGELDREGHLRVTGRRSDRIVSGGVNVDPAEVEAVLRLDSDVHDVSVVGLPDAEWGEIVAGAVVPRPGSEPSGARLEALARERLASAKVPRRVVFLSELPRNANGKVDRARVRELVAQEIAERSPVPAARVPR
jgi:acyl-CoA synthetase (AMP-forming)/AMP-acid ligase II